MKKKLLISFLFLCIFNIKVDALCYDDDFNEWADKAEIEFIDFNKNLINEKTGKPLRETMIYSYVLTTNIQREDIVMKANTSYGSNLEGIYIPGHKVYGIADYTPKDGVKYDITIYGSKDSACPNEVIKTFKYEVEKFNFYFKTEKCEKYPDAPLCKRFKNTDDITLEEFNQEMDEYIDSVEPHKKGNWFSSFLKFMVSYGVFILIPFIVIALLYMVKIGKTKKMERNK